MERISDNKFILLKICSFKFSPQKNCLSDVDGANSIRDYFLCQQLISRDRFSGSYLGNNLSGINKASFCDYFYKNSPNFYWKILSKNT